MSHYTRSRCLFVDARRLCPEAAKSARQYPGRFDRSLIWRRERCLGTSDPRLKAALVILGECWPQALPFDELAMRINARLYDDPVDSVRFRDDWKSDRVAPGGYPPGAPTDPNVRN